VGALIAQTKDANERSQVLAAWRLAEKTWKDELAKGANPAGLSSFRARLPGVGELSIEHEAASAAKRIVRVRFDTASAAKRARGLLKKDFQYDPA
jgi:hypothetical protein